jgi:hypothetical protein
LDLLVIVGPNTIGGLDLLLAAATRAALSNGDASRDVESLHAVTSTLSCLSLAFLSPGVVDTAAACVGIWISNDILTLVGSGTSMPEVEFSVVWSLAVSLTLGLVIAKNILKSKVLDGLVSWEAVTYHSVILADSAVSLSSFWSWGSATLWYIFWIIVLLWFAIVVSLTASSS